MQPQPQQVVVNNLNPAKKGATNLSHKISSSTTTQQQNHNPQQTNIVSEEQQKV